VPLSEGENMHEVVIKICEALHVNVTKSDLDECIPKTQSHNQGQMIIATFNKIRICNEVWKAYIKNRNLTIRDIYPESEVDSRVYISQGLTRYQIRLKNSVMRNLITTKKAVKCDIKQGRILVFRSNNSAAIEVSCEDDIQRLSDEWSPVRNDVVPRQNY
jgi:hypothetical protein